jgi:RHH-type transcriptional regulator, proline utilization regulon repressor / proline dehydrogenase / delta 1-pyrroline-5-carboxylate dehydrogenase
MTDVGHEHTDQLAILRTKHLKEEREEAVETLIDRPRPLKVVCPQDGDLPLSTEYLKRLYANDRMAKEKKPGLFDHLRSVGPWMTSIDPVPLSVLDGMSQTATLTHGFAADPVVRAYMNGDFGDASLTSYDPSISNFEAANRYAQNLVNRVAMLDHVSFTNSGAEANEKAFSLCRSASAYPKAKRVLGFKGSFHGRTLLALQTTWNPLKRAPFELPSYLSVFVDFPLMDATKAEETEWPEGLTQALTQTPDPSRSLEQLKGASTPLFDQEIESLCQVARAALTGEVFTAIIEPMQSEGGDRYATARFYRALRMLTRTVGLPLIFDEVQTGFGLGGPFDWSSKFNLVDSAGAPDSPDAITYAKRAQVGVCISRFEDPEPSSAHLASMIRADLTTDAMDFGPMAERISALIKPRIHALAKQFPALVAAPRNTGFAFAFDLPTPAHLMAYLGQRFWRGAVVFGAGTKTVRYRLSNAFEPRHLDILFQTIEQSLQHVAIHGDAPSPKWINATQPVREAGPKTRVRVLGHKACDEILPRLLEIEAETYEPARQDTAQTLSLGFREDGVVVVAEIETDSGWLVVGSALAGPLESFSQLDGPKQDSNLGQHNTVYSIALTLHPNFHGLGLGRKLKQAQVLAARSLTNPDGSPRYFSMVGRNRIGMTDSMGHLNDSFGAYTLTELAHQYGEVAGRARYYSIPLHGFVPSANAQVDRRLHWSAGISAPFAQPPSTLEQRRCEGTLFGPTVNKVTICNYVTPSVVRAVEWAGSLTPELPHLYLSSGRDELIDKSVRLLRYQRKEAETCLSFQGCYMGHTSATARSISCQSVHQQGEAIFDWPSIPHPEDDVIASLTALDEAVTNAGGSSKILGLFVEPVGERSGKVIDQSRAKALNEWSKRHQIPLVGVETASAYRRCYETDFAYQSIGLDIDLLAWWPGGQTGFLHTSPTYFIAKPLMMVSTWDGDELSMIRFHHQSMAVTAENRSDRLTAQSKVFDALTALGLSVQGIGSYRLLVAGDAAPEFADRCRKDGLELKPFANGLISLVLPYDVTQAQLDQGIEILTRHAGLLHKNQ